MIPTTIGKELFPIGVLKVCQTLIKHGKKAYVVGGSIRDIILSNNRPVDWDIATNATPKEIIDVFEKKFKVIPTGVKHGTVTILYDHLPIEITTFRIDSDYLDSRRPSRVDFVDDIKQDLARRDLTINAIAYDPIHNKFQDPFKGLEDIQNKIIRTVGSPDDRLEEDGLRVIRIFRFVSNLGFDIESETFMAIPNHFGAFSKVSNERIHTELQKLLLGKYWKRAVSLLVESGLMFCIFPEFKHERMNETIPDLDISRMAFTFLILGNLSSEASLRLKYAVLLHQLSSVTKELHDYFPRIDKRFIEEILKRLKFSNKQIFEIIHILSTHRIPLPVTSEYLDEQKNYLIRKLLFRVKREFLDDYLFFLQAKFASLQKEDKISSEFLHEIRSRSKTQKPIEVRDLVVSGDDIIQYFHLDKSHASQRELIGLCLSIIRERVEFNPQINMKKEIYLILENLSNTLWKYDRIVTHYGSNHRFDIPFVRTRCIRQKIDFPTYGYLWLSDTYAMAKKLLCLKSNRQGRVAGAILGEDIKTKMADNHWLNVKYGTTKEKKTALKYIADEHCYNDVIQLDENYLAMKPFMREIRTGI